MLCWSSAAVSRRRFEPVRGQFIQSRPTGRHSLGWIGDPHAGSSRSASTPLKRRGGGCGLDHQHLRPDRMGSFAAPGAIELASVPAAAILASTHSLRRCPLQSQENLRVRLPPCQKHWRPALSYSERNEASRAKLNTAKRALPRCTVSSPPCDQSQRGRRLGLPVGAVSSASSAAPATWWGIVLANLREAAGAIPAPGLDLASLCASSAASPMSLGACCP